MSVFASLYFVIALITYGYITAIETEKVFKSPIADVAVEAIICLIFAAFWPLLFLVVAAMKVIIKLKI